MRSERATDVMAVVVLSGVVNPAEIELVCLVICNACRGNSADYALVIDTKNISLIRASTQTEASPSSPCSASPHHAEIGSRDTVGTTADSSDTVPSLPSAPVQGCSRILPHRRIHSLALRVVLPLSQVVWPHGLRILKFGWKFDLPLDRPLPSSLLRLELGSLFNRHIEEVSWPVGLQILKLGDGFNRQVEMATWPATLRHISFGSNFDQPIAGVVWPASLRDLRFGDAFNQPLNLAGADNLTKLELGMAFRCPVDDVTWPQGLKELKFGACFDQRLLATELPRGLRLLRLPDVYNMHDTTFEPAGLPKGCRLCIDRTEIFDLLLY